MHVSVISKFFLSIFFLILCKRDGSLHSDFTLKLICLASSLASLSAWLDTLPDVSGKRAVFIDVPHISQQKSCDLPTKDIAQNSMFSVFLCACLNKLFAEQFTERQVVARPMLRIIFITNTNSLMSFRKVLTTDLNNTIIYTLLIISYN